MATNIPQNPVFELVGVFPLQPTAAGSGQTVAAQSNTAFKANYANGGSLNSLTAAVNGFGAPNLFTTRSSVQYPTYEEYSLQIQQEFSRSTSVQIAYAGNHGYHEPVVAGNANASTQGVLNFAGIPTNSPATSFAAVTDLSSSAPPTIMAYSSASFIAVNTSPVRSTTP